MCKVHFRLITNVKSVWTPEIKLLNSLKLSSSQKTLKEEKKKRDIKEEKPKSTDGAKQQDSVQGAEDFAVDSKVSSILQAFSAEHDIFWFRYFVVSLASPVNLSHLELWTEDVF